MKKALTHPLLSRYLSFREKVSLVLGLILEKLLKLIPQHILYKNYFIQQIHEKNYEIKRSGKGYLVKWKMNQFFIRSHGSDMQVFQQIIIDAEYEIILKLSQQYNLKLNRIIDAGANVGYTTMYIKKFFPNAEVIAIEPDPNNYEVLKKNIEINKIYRVKCLNAGIWDQEGKMAIDYSFRDGKEWSRRLKPSNDEQNLIPVISLKKLMEDNRWTNIDFLKIDIEGAEETIFANENINYVLAKTKIISIEVHHPEKIGHVIISLLIKQGFQIHFSGELLIGIKQ